MDFAELKAELDEGRLRRVYIFTGEERSVMQKYIQRIASMVSSAGTILRAPAFKEAVPYLQSKGLFEQRRTVVIDNERNIDNLDQAWLYETVGKNCVIFTFDEVDMRRTFFKTKANLIVTFKRFTPEQMVWLVRKLLPVDVELAEFISSVCGGDVGRIENECHKLSHLGRSTTRADVEELITPPTEDRIFDMIDAAAKGQRQRSWRLYQDLLELRESPVKIVSLLYAKIRQVFLVQSYQSSPNADIQQKTGLNYYQVVAAREAAGVLSSEHLLKLLKLAQRMEMEIKSGRMDQDLAADALMLHVLGGA